MLTCITHVYNLGPFSLLAEIDKEIRDLQKRRRHRGLHLRYASNYLPTEVVQYFANKLF